jgi:hypothetical protein
LSGKNLCTGREKGGREIDRSEYADVVEENSKRYIENAALYRKRQEINEHIFGTIKRRWRHKQTGFTIQRDFSFIADGSKFTSELSDFLKDASGYATRYHEKYSQLLFREWQEIATTL